ncbi:hypothetical protein A3762_04830 [Oleiphilus sp. HI0125]|uniref:hypothetical protein n=2 Tax=unclassified Oleiphilus TaxID=2631174 RepID=UPI0007C30BAD|nr:hypothetical protein [Oleiphilus sp. HI0125]KZZ58292.1 hypothetical protein A3762_18470 [Oleiphilus sp. HI0125]KZZ59418.1 hypothetical protein A3762_04830 [Oleiphilus sp. HI0125]
MSAVTITIAIGSLICAGIALIVFVQAREKARIERLRLIIKLQDRHTNIQNILSNMPPQYLNPTLRKILHEQSIETIKELTKFKPSSKHAGYIQEDERAIKELQENPQNLPPVKVDSTEKAREVRIMLQNLYKLLHFWRKKSQLSPDLAQQQMAHVGFLARQSKADLFAEKAKQAELAGKPRVAIHNYHSAIEVLSDVSTHPSAMQNIQAYKQKMAELNKKADQRTEEINAKAQGELEQSSEWDDFLSPEEDWKKKNSYYDD